MRQVISVLIVVLSVTSTLGQLANDNSSGEKDGGPFPNSKGQFRPKRQFQNQPTLSSIILSTTTELPEAPTTASTTTTSSESDASLTFAERRLDVDADDRLAHRNTLDEDAQEVELSSVDGNLSIPDDASLANVNRAASLRASGDDQITFGRFDDLCEQRNYTYEDVVYDEVMQCQTDHEQKCFSTQETTFTSYNTEVCDETFTKVCAINFLQETNPVTVQVCYNKAGKICDDDLQRSGRQSDPNTCVEVYETVCETVKRFHVVEDDIASCKQEKLEVCLQRDGCPTVPKTKCTITKQNTTKEYSDTQCKKVKKSVCGPDECPIRFLPEICTNETKLVTSSIPVEKCELIPKKDCRQISTLVPGLHQAEKCLQIPKEICSKVQVPRRTNRTSTKYFCPDQDIARAHCTSNNFKKDNGKWACYFFLDEGLPYTNASQQCTALDARLPEIYSERENADILSLKPVTTNYLKGIWLGSVQKTANGPYQWNSSGLGFTYANWDTNQPDNNNGMEHCLTMLSAEKNGKWNDYGCNYEIADLPTQYTMCEKIIN